MSINLLRWGSTPGTPGSSSLHRLYAKATGIYEMRSDGVERLLTHAIEPLVFSVMGTVAVQTGRSRIYLEGSYVFESARASVNTAPTGAALTVDINKNGTTIYTTQASRPSVAISGNTNVGSTPDVTSFSSGDYITVDVDQIGSTIAGADLTVVLRLRKT